MSALSEVNADFPPKLACLFKPHRYKVAYGGRGSAKSWSFARALLISGLQKPLRILCAREIQKSIKQSVHTLLCDQIQALGLGGFYATLEAEIRGLNGTTFTFSGLATHTVESIKSFEGVDKVWVEEGQTVSKRSWNILVPTIRKPGSEIWVSFNPELDTDETYQRFVVNPPSDSAVVSINYTDNPWFPEVLEQERLDQQKRDPEEYENIWEGKPKTVVAGAIYKKEVIDLIESKRVCNVPYDPALKVHTVWDLGWNDSMTVILVQKLRSEVRIIGYIEDSHKTLAEYVSMLQAKSYAWGKDYLPHDGAAKDFKTGKSAKELIEKLGRRVEIVDKLDVEGGIKAARMVFPRCYFDRESTSRLIDCLKRYRRSINQTTNEPGPPLHDEYSHGADAFRYLAVCVDKMSNDEFLSGKINYPNLGVV